MATVPALRRPEQLAGMGYVPAPGPPKIYIYELPPRYTTQ